MKVSCPRIREKVQWEGGERGGALAPKETSASSPLVSIVLHFVKELATCKSSFPVLWADCSSSLLQFYEFGKLNYSQNVACMREVAGR